MGLIKQNITAIDGFPGVIQFMIKCGDMNDQRSISKGSLDRLRYLHLDNRAGRPCLVALIVHR